MASNSPSGLFASTGPRCVAVCGRNDERDGEATLGNGTPFGMELCRLLLCKGRASGICAENAVKSICYDESLSAKPAAGRQRLLATRQELPGPRGAPRCADPARSI